MTNELTTPEDEEDEIEESDEPTPDEEDAYVQSNGYGYSVSFGYKHLGDVAEDDEADALIRQAMIDEQYWPNVWTVSDHGNVSLRTISDDES